VFDHLVSKAASEFVPEIDDDSGEVAFTPVEKINAAQTLGAQSQTANWLAELTQDDEAIIDKAQEQKVSDTFQALATQDPKAKNKLLEMQVPEEIRASVAMVTAYQWKFVEQANEMRAMAVAKIVKETDHPDARIRLKALEMLGKVTEVALFTDRVEVRREEMSDEELEKQIRERLGKYMGDADVVDAEVKKTDE